MSYLNEQGREQREFEITKNGFAFLGFGFTGARADEFKERYIDAFDAMERQLREQQALPDEAVRVVSDLSEMMQGGDKALVSKRDLVTFATIAYERLEAARRGIEQAEAELDYVREAIEVQIGETLR